MFWREEGKMKEYYAYGELMKGFLGNLTYETILPEGISEVSVRVSFQKREMEACTEADRQQCRDAWIKNTNQAAEEAAVEEMIRRQKTEINVSVFHNGAYLGCAHRDEMTKEILLSPRHASPGFTVWKPSGGVLRVVLHVYQVLNDHTPYEVEVIGRERME